MEKQFKCQACGHVFTADTNKYVTCPNCESDNVAIENGSKKIIPIIGGIVGGLVVLAGVFFGVKYLKDRPSEDTGYDTPAITTPTVENTTSEETETEVPKEIIENLPASVSIDNTQPVYNASTGKYSIQLNVTVEKIEGYTLKIEAINYENGALVESSSDGKFTKLPPATSAANPDGFYVFRVEVYKDGKVAKTDEKLIPGFRKVESNIKKITALEVQNLINSGITAADLQKNKGFASSVSVSCTNPKDGYAPNNFSKLLKDLHMGTITAVQVSNVNYNSMNQINNITVTVTWAD